MGHGSQKFFSEFQAKGECETSITIDCPPGFESRIAEYFPAADGYQTRGLLGANDVLVQTTKPVPTGQFVSTLFNFRRQWASSLHAPLASVTSVLSVQNNLDSQTEGYDIEISLEELAPLVSNHLMSGADCRSFMVARNQSNSHERRKF